ncbi:MAG: RNA polymerase sigma-70 factor [Balneolaceae bacterium]
MNLSDRELGIRISRGDREAFGELYNRYHKQLYYLSIKYLKEKSLAEDAVQDVFVKLWSKRNRIDPGKGLRGLLFVSLRNDIMNKIEKNRRRILTAFESEDDHRSSDDVFLNYLEKEYEGLYNDGLKKLPKRRREVFELKVSGLTNSEIAEQLAISENTVKVHYYHGTKFIREYLRVHGGIALLVLLAVLSFYG